LVRLAKAKLNVALSAGPRLGPHEIQSALGAGGMGEVYRARDTKLNRDVALKVLPETYALDPDHLARFKREAQVLAALNHPNIGAIYGFEESGDRQALVLELVEGPTLADRIRQGPIPLAEALAIAQQIAEALEAAHEQSVIHRDLKPANIKLRPDGTVKVLDFGLAKALEPTVAVAGDVTASPTITSPALTQMRVILGTAAYMSPEQARGNRADRRADIWSFGAVLFEMLAGRKAFEGESASDTLSSVLKLDPDWRALPAPTPPAIRTLIERCLTKDRRQRLQAIGEARIALEHPPRATEVAPATRIRLLWPALAALFATLAAGVGVVHFRERLPLVEPVRFQIPLPENLTNQGLPPSAISPDGRQLAYFAVGSDGKRRLWIRALSSLETKPLAGSEVESIAIPFWSPDSRYVAFADDGKLKKIAIAGGPPTILCDVPPGPAPGGAWNQDDVVLFGINSGINSRDLSRVSATGGAPSLVVRQGIFPAFLPDGRHFLYLSFRGSRPPGVYLGSLDAVPEAQDARRLLASIFAPVYAPSSDGNGYVLFPREGTLLAQAFDARRLELKGEPVPIAEHVGAGGVLGAFSASANGTLVYMSGGTGIRAQWFDRRGTLLGDVGDGGPHIALSPDGARATTTLMPTAGTASSNLWLLDLSRGRRTRFTLGSSRDADPVWSPDGRRIVFASSRGDRTDLFLKAADASGDEQVLIESGERKSPTSWSRDGRYLLFTSVNPKTKSDVWVLLLDGNRKPIPVLRTEFNETHAYFSPDARWMAYISDESGKNEAYVRRFVSPANAESPTGEGKWLVSSNGAETVRWRRDGKELFYEAPDGTIMTADVTSNPSLQSTFQAGTPQPLFQTYGVEGGRYWDPSADGQRFLVSALGGRTGQTPFTVVLNWQVALKK
jgi:serine/threonine protein kinase